MGTLSTTGRSARLWYVSFAAATTSGVRSSCTPCMTQKSSATALAFSPVRTLRM